jgi:hypothetical protein
MWPVQVADWLDTIPSEREHVRPADAEDLSLRRDELDRVAVEALERVGAGLSVDDLPVRVPKSRLADLARCERLTVARATGDVAETTVSVAALKGVVLDQFVAHQLMVGRVVDPVPTAVSMLRVSGRDLEADAVDSLDPSHADGLLGPLATAVADGWSGLDPAWAPRTQSRATVVLADGRCDCTGVIDVELGGPGTGLPSVLVEVKSGAPAAEHPHEVYLYALLVALRDGRAPVAVARWYPGSAPAAVQVGPGVLDAAQARLSDGIRRWAELSAGRTPTEQAGSWCTWCPDADRCPTAPTDRPLPGRVDLEGAAPVDDDGPQWEPDQDDDR